jgi:HAD superfamily phosphatase (TIGR01668 family)
MSLFLPTKIFKIITDITVEDLKSLGISSLLIDVDNTLSTHHGTVLVDGLTEWLSVMRENNINLIVVSNSKKARIKPFAGRIGLPFVSLACKPLPFGYAKAIDMLGVKSKSVAIIGDQIFTDILGAKMYGIKSLLVRPQRLEDGWSFKVRRYFERKILKDNF